MLMHNCKIIIAKTTPETVGADGVPDTTPPVYRPCGSAGSLKIIDERAGWAEKPGVHVVLGWIKPSSSAATIRAIPLPSGCAVPKRCRIAAGITNERAAQGRTDVEALNGGADQNAPDSAANRCLAPPRARLALR